MEGCVSVRDLGGLSELELRSRVGESLKRYRWWCYVTSRLFLLLHYFLAGSFYGNGESDLGLLLLKVQISITLASSTRRTMEAPTLK